MDLKAGVIYSIKQKLFFIGSTYVLYDQIKKTFHKIIYHIDDEVFDEYLNTLVEEGRVIKEENIIMMKAFVVKNHGKFYTK